MPLPQLPHSAARTWLVAVLALTFLLSFAAPVLARPAAPTVLTNIPLHAEFTPNDPYYISQWGLGTIDAPQAWDVTLGSPNVTVAVVDTGVWYTNPDIVPNMWTNTDGTHGYNFLNNTEYPFDTDSYKGTYHGTGVAGVIAADTNNNLQVAGVAQIKIMALAALGPNGEGTSTNTSKAIQYAVNHGARIINLSLGTNTTLVGPTDIELAINYAWSKGALIVAAAGNSGSNTLDYPASLPNVVSVGSVDPTGDRSSFSNYGQGLSLTAPGRQIYTLNGGDLAPHQLDGTSLATPFVSGVAALLLSLEPTLTNVELWNILNQTAVPKGGSPSPQCGSYSIEYGCGVVNAWNAINALNRPFISVNSYPGSVSKGSTFSVGWSILGPAGVPVTDTHILYGTDPNSLSNATQTQTGTTRQSYSAGSLPMPQGATSMSFKVVATVNATHYESRVYTVAASNLPDFLFVLYEFLSSNLLYLAIFILVLAAIVAFVPQRRARARRSAAYRARTAAPPPYPYAAPPPGPPPAQPPAPVKVQSTEPPPPIEFVHPSAPPTPATTTAPPPPPVAAKKRCPNCGTLVNADNMFCFFCGHPFR